MIIEISRDEFPSKIEQTYFPAGEWVAISFLLLYKDRKQLNLPTHEMEQLIEIAKGIFVDFQEGFFSRLGWTSYLACMKSDENNANLILENRLVELGKLNKNCLLWKYNIAPLNGDPKKIIWELEWKSHKDIKY